MTKQAEERNAMYKTNPHFFLNKEESLTPDNNDTFA